MPHCTAAKSLSLLWVPMHVLNPLAHLRQRALSHVTPGWLDPKARPTAGGEWPLGGERGDGSVSGSSVSGGGGSGSSSSGGGGSGSDGGGGGDGGLAMGRVRRRARRGSRTAAGGTRTPRIRRRRRGSTSRRGPPASRRSSSSRRRAARSSRRARRTSTLQRAALGAALTAGRVCRAVGTCQDAGGRAEGEAREGEGAQSAS